MQKEIDKEWVLLIQEALKLGITEKEISDFLKDHSRPD
ncbi:anti-repressor SinI family protein [Lederbergia lenta]|nr:anti-repressor SinI family protein [Lederbergia lenta]MCM3110666.1 anti-repressor SinI family protein [Lederbergia lenta]